MVEFIFTAGPLGSGKTTFLNAIAPGLERTSRVGAAISDLGVLNDDARRIKINKKGVTGFKAGCVCCERKQDLENLVGGIGEEYDYFMVEPSGASNVYDMIQVVQEAKARDKPYFNVGNVFTMVPVAHLEAVKTLRALRAGVQAASTIILTKANNGAVKSANQFLDEMGATSSRVCYNGEERDLSYLLKELPKWCEPLMPVASGHEHFDKISFSIPPKTTREELLERLKRLKELGVARVKGLLPSQGYEFDLSYGDISISNYSGNQIASRGTVIFQGSSERITEVINSFNIGGASDVNHGVENASIDGLLQTFHYHLRFSSQTAPLANLRVRANFEGTDDAYTLGKEIYLRTNGEESAPLEMALVPYLDVRYKGLLALDTQTQEDRNYVGVMLGSYMVQMLGEKDNVPFNRLVESKWLQRIKEDVAPRYFRHLAGFGKLDLSYFAKDDKHFPFFAWMAERAAPYVDRQAIKVGAENMAQVHNSEISQRWRKLANG